ncbi:MAG TPA: hypothetical protein VER39_04540 [Nocardioidaceae bacterium]|nr:hypothetical protein [Nocardioidaceae bacterium]
MNTATRVAAFVVAIAAVFAVALGAGRVLGPSNEPAAVAHDAHGVADESESPQGVSGEMAELPGGLMMSQSGYTLSLDNPQATPGKAVPVKFTITGPDGRLVTTYETEHEKQLHLIAVRRDFTGFQHVHPELARTGVWSAKIDLTGGQWRLFADFKAANAEALTLGADLAVTGEYQPATERGQVRTAEVDGYTVTLDGDLKEGSDAKLTLSVTRNGKPVTDLQPYLDAYGHLVALRSGDLAYLHVHPDGTPDDGVTKPGPEVVFYAAVPSPSTYHLYLDFKHDGVVRTAAFTVNAGEGASAQSASSAPTSRAKAPAEAPAHSEHGGH